MRQFRLPKWSDGHPISATYIARQMHVTPHAARLWLSGVNIPKEQNLRALASWLKVDPRWLRYGGVLEDSFITDYMSLSEENNLEAQAFSTRLASQLKANGHPVSATYIARQIHVTHLLRYYSFVTLG